MYWSDQEDRQIKKLRLNGTGNKEQNVLSNVSPYVLAISPDYLYFRDAEDKSVSVIYSISSSSSSSGFFTWPK